MILMRKELNYVVSSALAELIRNHMADDSNLPTADN